MGESLLQLPEVLMDSDPPRLRPPADLIDDDTELFAMMDGAKEVGDESPNEVAEVNERPPERLGLCVYPNKILTTPCDPVDPEDPEIAELVVTLIKGMTALKGLGLAAPQVGVAKRVAVTAPPDGGDIPIVLINPVILEAAGNQRSEEGCLSMPMVSGVVNRAKTVVVETSLPGSSDRIVFDVSDLAAAIVQHELDHLDGVMFFQRLNPTQRRRVIEKYRKLRKRASRRAKKG